MSDEVLEHLISSYMATNQKHHVFVWQGGEPTLMGTDFFQRVVKFQQKYGKPGGIVSNALQTNATLIDDELAAHFSKYNFLVGVSLDGPEYLHDKNRVTGSGKGTHAEVLKGIECLKRHKVEFNVLVLVNAANVTHGRRIYRYLHDMKYFFHQYIPCVEFDKNSNNKPYPYTITGKQWGKFLCEVFDEWFAKDTFNVSVRLFDSILEYLVHDVANVCHMSTNCNSYFMVEYNGDVYPCDFFADQPHKLGNILKKSWQDLQTLPKYLRFGKKKSEWNKLCDNCRYLTLCAADCIRHRLDDHCNPRSQSWLCDGWKLFYDHTVNEFNKLAGIIQSRQIRESINSQQLFGRPSQQMIKKIGRNDPCPCCSGIKYKKCCGR